MSLKFNIAANYGGQIYVTAIGILVLPLYVRHLGAEAYGLVGFFTLLQNWFNLLDLGLSPTIARETARYRGSALSAIDYLRLLRSLQMIFLCIALIGGGGLFLFSDMIAHTWLKVQTLSYAEVRTSIQLMAICVALRWMSGLFRGGISGAERFIWLNGFNCGIATLRFLGVLPLLLWVSTSPVAFFAYQLAVAIIELVGLRRMLGRISPAVPAGESIGWSMGNLVHSISPVLKFAMSTAFTSAMWALVTQTDKLILSTKLPLDQYGYYSLAVLVAGAVLMVAGPITNSVMPKIAKFHAEGRHDEIVTLYRSTTQWVAVIVVPVTTAVAMFAHQLLFVWTGDAKLVANAAPILVFYTIGNGLLTLSGLPILLQYAWGNLRLHVIGNVIYGVSFFPALIWATNRYGITGACWTWLTLNLASFLLWLPVVHRTFLPKMHLTWLGRDVCAILATTLVAAGLLFWGISWRGDRFLDLLIFIVVGGVLVASAALGSSTLRGVALRLSFFRRNRA